MSKAEHMSRPERSKKPFEDRLADMIKERDSLNKKKGKMILSTKQALRLHRLEQVIDANIQAVVAS